MLRLVTTHTQVCTKPKRAEHPLLLVFDSLLVLRYLSLCVSSAPLSILYSVERETPISCATFDLLPLNSTMNFFAISSRCFVKKSLIMRSSVPSGSAALALSSARSRFVMLCGRSSSSMQSLLQTMTLYSMQLRSSRTLPGQSYSVIATTAAGLIS